MGAFFSGTDDNDDRNKTYYTGVIGQIRDDSFAVKLRFNLNDRKRECPVSEIFELPPEEEIEIPKEWLDRIEVGYAYQGHNRGAVHGSAMDDAMRRQGIGFGYGGPSVADIQKQTGATLSRKERRRLAKANKRQGRPSPVTSLGVNDETGCVEFQSGDSLPGFDKEYIDYLTTNFGEKIANGYDQIMAGLQDLVGQDDLLEDLFREAADQLTISSKREAGLPDVISPNTTRVKDMSDESTAINVYAEFGDDIATSFEQAIEGMKDITGCDIVMKKAIAELLGLMSVERQISVGTLINLQ